MEKPLSLNLSDLAVESIDTTMDDGAVTLESLMSGHGMTEAAASAIATCVPCCCSPSCCCAPCCCS